MEARKRQDASVLEALGPVLLGIETALSHVRSWASAGFLDV